MTKIKGGKKNLSSFLPLIFKKYREFSSDDKYPAGDFTGNYCKATLWHTQKTV